jgi:hypothetical protein
MLTGPPWRLIIVTNNVTVLVLCCDPLLVRWQGRSAVAQNDANVWKKEMRQTIYLEWCCACQAKKFINEKLKATATNTAAGPASIWIALVGYLRFKPGQ